MILYCNFSFNLLFEQLIILILITFILCAGAIAVELDEHVTETLQTQPFSLLCDESNNIKHSKEFVIMARVYDETEMQVATRFVDMPVCNMGTAENLYANLESTLR